MRIQSIEITNYKAFLGTHKINVGGKNLFTGEVFDIVGIISDLPGSLYIRKNIDARNLLCRVKPV